MAKYRYIVLFVLALCIGIAGVLFFTKKPTQTVDQAYYRNALSNAKESEQVSIQGVLYTVINGTVYKNNAVVSGTEATIPLLLAYEKTVARRTPLIALPGTDPAKLAKAIPLLRQTQAGLASMQQSGAERAVILSALYPIDFLQAADTLEADRQTFLQSGSDTDARAYEQAGAATAAAYQDDLEKFRRGFILEVPKDAPPYVTVRNYTDYDDFIARFTALKAGMQKTEVSLVTRGQCFRGKNTYCNSSDLAMPDVAVPTMQPPSAQTTAEAESRLLLHPLVNRLAGTDLSQEPLYALASSSCSEYRLPTALFILPQATDINGDPYKSSSAVGDGRLVDATTEPDEAFFKFFLDHGVRYINSTPFVYYECLEYPLDLEKVYGMDLVQSAMHAPATEPITQKTADQYVASAIAVAKNGAPSDATSKAIELALAVNDNSSQFENLVTTISEMERINTELFKRGVPVGLGTPYLFYTRNAFADFFLINNPSVAGGAGSTFKTSLVPAADQPYIYYDSLTPAQQAEENNDQEFYYQMHTNPTAGY